MPTTGREEPLMKVGIQFVKRLWIEQWLIVVCLTAMAELTIVGRVCNWIESQIVSQPHFSRFDPRLYALARWEIYFLVAILLANVYRGYQAYTRRTAQA